MVLGRMFNRVATRMGKRTSVCLLVMATSVPFVTLCGNKTTVFHTVKGSRMSVQMSLLVGTVGMAKGTVLIFKLQVKATNITVPALVSEVITTVIVAILLYGRAHVLRVRQALGVQFSKEVVQGVLTVKIPGNLRGDVFRLNGVLILDLISAFNACTVTTGTISGTVTLFRVLPKVTVSLTVAAIVSRYINTGSCRRMRCCLGGLLTVVCITVIKAMTLVFLTLPLVLGTCGLSSRATTTTAGVVRFRKVDTVVV